jgi:hypothetical protein
VKWTNPFETVEELKDWLSFVLQKKTLCLELENESLPIICTKGRPGKGNLFIAQTNTQEVTINVLNIKNLSFYNVPA